MACARSPTVPSAAEWQSGNLTTTQNAMFASTTTKLDTNGLGTPLISNSSDESTEVPPARAENTPEISALFEGTGQVPEAKVVGLFTVGSTNRGLIALFSVTLSLVWTL